MPTPTKGPRLGGGPAHERLILANLATALFTYDRVTTTEAKAKRLRPLAERLVTFAKRGDLHARRRVMTVVRDKSTVHRLFVEIAPDMEDRPGGYTRITKIGARKGDNAPMAVIELIREPVAKKATVKEAEAATKRAAKDSGSAKDAKDDAAAEADDAAAVDDATEVEDTAAVETGQDETVEATDETTTATDDESDEDAAEPDEDSDEAAAKASAEDESSSSDGDAKEK